jgi:hypothetical protein
VFHCDISIYTYIVPGLFHPLHYSPSSPPPVLKLTSTGFNVPYSHVWKYFNHIHPCLPSSFSLPVPLLPPLNMTCFTFLPFIVLVFSGVFVLVFYLQIFCYFTCKYIVLSSVNPSTTLPYPFPILCIVQQLSVCFIVSCSYTNVTYFNITHLVLKLNLKLQYQDNIYSIVYTVCLSTFVYLCQFKVLEAKTSQIAINTPNIQIGALK